MPKRKRETKKTGAHLTQEPSARRSSQKRARPSSLPVQKEGKQRRENKRWRALSTTGSTGEDVSRDHSVPTSAALPEQRCLIQLSENNTEISTNDTSFESHLGRTYSARSGSGTGYTRNHETELGRVGIESDKRPRETEPAAASPNWDPKEPLEWPGDGLSERQKVPFEESVPRTSVPVVESPEKPAKELGAREIEQKERQDPISYWAAHRTWPENFAEHDPMASSNSTNKRQRTLDRDQSSKDERSRSYSQNRKNGEVPEQYTAAYEAYILTKGLDMNYRKGRDFVSEGSKKTCAELLRINVATIGPTAIPQDKIGDIVDDCQNRNEAMVIRDITPLMIPSLRLLYHCGANNLEHAVDEVNADWFDQCILEGPRLRPDLAIGLCSSAFTEGEIEKLKRYTSVDNWTQLTMHMFFPFLMCEVKCGREGLDMADRQNMHSCSVAVRALLRLEQEADKYRPEKTTDSLNGQVLVFSISHDQQDARLYGHYAIMRGEKWTYYRYRVRKFDLTDNTDLLAIHNFVQNILKSHLPGHVRRLKDALAALPDPNKPPGSSGPPSSSGLSFTASGMSLNDNNTQQDVQVRDADGFVVPPRPNIPRTSGVREKGQESRLVERIDRLMQQLEEEKEENRKREERLLQQLKEEKEENRKRDERQRQEHKEEMERQRQEHKEKMDLFLQQLTKK